jgi:hypothetical protein
VFCLLYTPVNIAMIMFAAKLSFKELLMAACRGIVGASAAFLVAFIGANIFEGSELPALVRLLICGAVSVSVGVAVTLRLDPELRGMIMEQINRLRRSKRNEVKPTAVAVEDEAAPVLSQV